MNLDLTRRQIAASLAGGAAGTIGGAIAGAVAPLTPSRSPTLGSATLTGLTRMGSGIATLSQVLTDYAANGQPADSVHWGRTTAGLTNPKLTFGYLFDFVTSSGAAETGYDRGKVGVYIGNTAANASAGDVYALNVLGVSNPGHAGHLITQEIDTNNLGSTADTRLINAVNPIRTAEYFSGVCADGNPLTANRMVNLALGAYKIARERGVYNGAVQGPIDEFACDAVSGTLATGSYSGSFLDIAGATIAGYAVKMARGHRLAWMAPSTAEDAVLSTNAGGTLVAYVPNGLALNGPIYPAADDAYDWGLSNVRIKTVYMVNGVSSSSDVSLKTDVADIPGDVALALVKGLAPKAWRWKEGGQDAVPVKVKVLEQATETVDGVERPLFDHEPVLGEDGVQIVDIVRGAPARPEIRVPVDPGKPDGETAVIQEARAAVPDREIPRTRPVPRMVAVERERVEHVARPGKRTHVGFLYQDVEAALAALAVDYGVCDRAKDPDGGPDRLFLRMERFTPLLWRVTQNLLDRAERTEARLAAIEARLEG